MQPILFFLAGLALGAIVRFPTFAIVAIATVLSYATFEIATHNENWFSHLLINLIAWQLGYFAAVILRVARDRYRIRR